MIAGLACGFSALGYSEFAARAPTSGSAYSFSYITVGELMAWIIGMRVVLKPMSLCTIKGGILR